MVIRVGPRINKTQFLFSQSFHGIFFIYFIYFGLSGSSLLQGLFSGCRDQGLLSTSGAQASRCCGFSCCKAQALGCVGFGNCGMSAQWLQLTGSRSQAQQLWHIGLSCSVIYGILSDQRSNPCLLHWQVDSLPLSHQGGPRVFFCHMTFLGVL